MHDVVVGFFFDVSGALDHAKTEELVHVHPPRGTTPHGLCLEAQQSYEWYSSSFQSIEWTGARHTGQRWCDNIGSSADGYATLVVAREPETMFVRTLNVIDTSMNTADLGTKYLSATSRRTLVVLMPLYYGESHGVVTMVSASREAGKTSSATTAA